MTKEEFNKVWKDTSREGILNQFYYDYRYMQKLKEDINKVLEDIKEYKEMGYSKYDENEIEIELIDKILETLDGGENNR